MELPHFKGSLLHFLYGLFTKYGCSGRGASSHQHNPFAVITCGAPSEAYGTAFGFSLLYSGNFQLEAEISETGRLRVNLGMNSQGFVWNLEPGESFCSPECILMYSNEGIGGISREFHRLFCEHLIPQRWRNFVPPVLINTWEAVYFNISHEVVIELASKAKELGIELIVLDDGWFGHRNDTTSSLGDWYPNPQKVFISFMNVLWSSTCCCNSFLMA